MCCCRYLEGTNVQIHPFFTCSLSLCFLMLLLIKNGARKYTGIDTSKSMLDAAKIMTSAIGNYLDCTFYEKSTDVIDTIKKSGERFDMVICAYTLDELRSDESRLIATQFLFDALEVNGLMIIIEKGNLVGSHTVRTA